MDALEFQERAVNICKQVSLEAIVGIMAENATLLALALLSGDEEAILDAKNVCMTDTILFQTKIALEAKSAEEYLKEAESINTMVKLTQNTFGN